LDILEVVRRGQPESFELELSDIQGELPAALDGVLFRNGPGTLKLGGDRVAFLDGHGMLGALEIAGGTAFLRTVHPETPLRQEEVAAGRMTRRRVFTNLPGWWKNAFNLSLGNPANHDSYVWGGKLVASDFGDHYALSLPELGFEGRLRWDAVTEKGELVAPMPREDLAKNTLVAYAQRRAASGDSLAFVEVNDAFEKVARTAPVPLRGFVHDCAFSDRYYVAFQNAAKPKALSALLGATPLWWTFDWRDEGPTLILAPRGREGEAKTIALDTSLRTLFHILNAHDDGDDVVIDAAGYDGVVHFDFIMPAAAGRPSRPAPRNRLVRIRANTTTGTATVTPFEGASGESPEVAPAVHGKPYGHAWFAALPSARDDEPYAYVLTRRVGHLDVRSGELTTWDAGEGHQLSPPAFAPDPSSDDPERGFVLVWDVDLEKETTDVVVLDARNLPRGPLARIRLGVYLPAVSHARFAPGARIRC
jgi:all-trans-8'-apo-beta-carotenal 15,15'-oxygenase